MRTLPPGVPRVVSAAVFVAALVASPPARAQAPVEQAAEAVDRADFERARTLLDGYFAGAEGDLEGLGEALRLRALVAFAQGDQAALERHLRWLRAIAPETDLGPVPPPLQAAWEGTEATELVAVVVEDGELQLRVEAGFEELVRGWRLQSADGRPRQLPVGVRSYPLQPGEAVRVSARLLAGAEIATACQPCAREAASVVSPVPSPGASPPETTDSRRRRRILGGAIGAALAVALAVAIAVPVATRDDGRTLNPPIVIPP